MQETPSMQPAPKVSVLMLAYNCGKYIADAINGVLMQRTNFPVQLVIADDCSSDDTYAICRKFQQQYPHAITLLRRETNMGLQRNLIDAYGHCQGEYVALCDGDDYWCYSRKLQVMVDYMDSHPGCALAFHRIVNYYQETGVKSLSNGGKFGRPETTLIDLCRGNYITNCSCMFRRKNIPQMPAWFADITLCDYATHLLNASHGDIHYFKRPMAVYRQHRDGLWSIADQRRRLSDAVAVRGKMLAHFRDNNLQEAYQALLPSYDSNAYKLLTLLPHDDPKAEELRLSLLQLHPGYTPQDIDDKVAQTSADTSKKPIIKRLLSSARALVSLCVPLPKCR